MNTDQNESMSVESYFIDKSSEKEPESQAEEKESQSDITSQPEPPKEKLSPEEEKLSNQKLFDNYKRDIGLYEFTMHKAIKSVEDWVKNVKTERAYKMRNDFDEEKEKKIEKQYAIKNQIEELSNDNENQKLISFFNEKIQQQEDLYQKFFDMKKIIDGKIKSFKENINVLEKKSSEQKDILRQLNRDNLVLMEQINKFEKDLGQMPQNTNKSTKFNFTNNSNLLSNNSTEGKNNNLTSVSTNVGGLSVSLNRSNLFKYSYFNDTKNNQGFNTSTNKSYFDNSHFEELIKKNEKLLKKQERNKELKKILNEKKRENDNLIKNINDMNYSYFYCKKIFSEGLHEIAKELLKINEMELEKVVNNTHNNSNSNSLYFDIFKTNYNSGQSKNDLLKLPMINANKNTKYKYPVFEKSEPSGLLYKVIKNIIEENNINTKIKNLKENKFPWEEFQEFSGYQIYTLLNINKDNLKKLEQCVFPSISPKEKEEK